MTNTIKRLLAAGLAAFSLVATTEAYALHAGIPHKKPGICKWVYVGERGAYRYFYDKCSRRWHPVSNVR